MASESYGIVYTGSLVVILLYTSSRMIPRCTRERENGKVFEFLSFALTVASCDSCAKIDSVVSAKPYIQDEFGYGIHAM